MKKVLAVKGKHNTWRDGEGRRKASKKRAWVVSCTSSILRDERREKKQVRSRNIG